mgnify:CR=1 FL=1
MWVEKIIIEKLSEDLRIHSLVIQDKSGAPMLISERAIGDEACTYLRSWMWITRRRGSLRMNLPFKVISETEDFEILEYSSKEPEWCEQRGNITQIHIRWNYIPLMWPYSGVCYWLRLPPNAVIVNLKKFSPKNDWNYSIVKDVEKRTLWLKCMFSREETGGRGLDFRISYKINSKEFDKYEERDSIRSWWDNIKGLGFGSNQTIDTIVTIIRRFLIG